MKILLAGAGGQLGRTLTTLLSEGSCALGAVPACYGGADIVSADLPRFDLADPAAVDTLVSQGRFDLIFNCAAFTNVDRCESEPDAALRANALGPRNLAAAVRKSGAKLVHVSTDYVFSGDGHTPYAEWELCAPQTVYGKTKLLGERYVRDFCERWYIVRTAWLYAHEGGNFVRTILKTAREKGRLQVVNDQHGNPTNAVDLAYHLLLIGAGEEYGLYHCTGNGVCTWYEFARRIVELADIPCEVSPCTTAEYPRPAPRPAYSALDHGMLRATVGDGMRNWEEALEAFIQSEREDGTL
jgi:dTDP-4-dehydrorhamnose reductase